MATIKTDLICNLNQPVNVTYLHGNLFSQDNAGNTINVFVMDNGEPATIGGTVSANVIRSDGQTVAVSGAIEGNKAYVILPQACYAVPGVVHIIIKLTQSTTVTTIAAIVANVYMSTTDAVIDPGTVIPSIQALMALIEEAVDSIPTDYTGLLHTIAADYSSSKTYKVGDYAWESGVLKRCIVPITAAETYTAAHWTNAVIGDDLTNLKSALVNTVCENLIGDDSSVYYPVALPNTSFYLNICTSDGSNFAHTAVPGTTMKLGLYDANKTLCFSEISLGSDKSYRDISISPSAAPQYVKLNIPSDVPLMVTLQSAAVGHAVTYVPYFFSAKQLTEEVKDLDTRVTVVETASDELADDVRDLSSDLTELDSALSDTISKNLLGEDYNAYYPVNFPNASIYLNIATSDGSNFAHTQVPATTMKLGLYDANKTLCASEITLGSDVSYRDVNITPTAVTKYIKLNIPSDVPLMVTRNNAAIGHAVSYAPYFLSAKQLTEEVKDIDTRVAAIENSTAIPAYYASHMTSKESSILSLDNVDIRVGFVTDEHYPANAKNSPLLMRHLWENVPMNFVVNNGDTLMQDDTKAEAMQSITKFNAQYDFTQNHYYPVIGNHEHNNSSGSSTSTQLSLAQVRLATLSKVKNAVFSDYTSYYIDDDSTKCRYYFVGTKQNSQLYDEDVGWITHSLLTIPDGYAVVVFSHAGLKHDENLDITGVQVKITTLCNALLAVANKSSNYHSTVGASEYLDFSALNATPIAVFSGHIHFDGNYQYTASIYNGYIYVIATTCDAYGTQPRGSVDRAAGTVNEQAFDVISVDKTNRLITMTRIGAGSDRTFTYSDYQPVS